MRYCGFRKVSVHASFTRSVSGIRLEIIDVVIAVFVVHHNADQLALGDNLGLIHAYADPLARVNRGLELSRRVCRLLFIRKAQNNDGNVPAR